MGYIGTCRGILQNRGWDVLKPGTPEHPGTLEKTRNTDFDGFVLLSYYRHVKNKMSM